MKTVAVDFDGTLHPYSQGWVGNVPADEPPIEGAREFLARLQRNHYKIVIFSARAATLGGTNGIVEWLNDHDLARYIAEVTDIKPAAVAYVDDRAVPFTGDYDAAFAAVRALTK